MQRSARRAEALRNRAAPSDESSISSDSVTSPAKAPRRSNAAGAKGAGGSLPRRLASGERRRPDPREARRRTQRAFGNTEEGAALRDRRRQENEAQERIQRLRDVRKVEEARARAMVRRRAEEKAAR